VNLSMVSLEFRRNQAEISVLIKNGYTYALTANR